MHPLLLHVKSFLAVPRAYLRAWGSYFSHRDQARRWGDIGNLDPDWDERTQLMAGMVPPGSSVLEFGSGREQLEKFLPAGCRYQPCDIVKRSERTLVADLNRDFPKLDAVYDVILISGVLEYIYEVEALFHKLRAAGRGVILSYATTDQLDCMTTRVGGGWVSHLSDAALRRIFADTGFTLTETRGWRQQTIYRLT